MSSDESSDEDIPLSSLSGAGGRKTRGIKQVNYNDNADDDNDDDDDDEAEFDFDREEEAAGNSDDDEGSEEGEIVEANGDDEEEGEIMKEDGDSSDDEDEPLSSLKSPKRSRKSTSTASEIAKSTSAKKAKTTTASKTKAKTPTKTKSKAKAKTKTKTSSTTKKKSTASSSSDAYSPSAALYNNSKKGQLISEVLKRWWYGMTWPEPSCIPKLIPPNCDKLDGFPGVYVTTSGDDVGKIIDFRNHDTCPNFKNMSKKSSEELKELLLSCVEEQRRVLVDNEGVGTQTEKELVQLEKWAKKVNGEKADKEAIKVLKASGFAL